jgi:hypothetical protein
LGVVQFPKYSFHDLFKFPTLSSTNCWSLPIFDFAETATPLQAGWIKPELCRTVVSFDMYVRGLVSISGIEEETVWPETENSGQSITVYT